MQSRDLVLKSPDEIITMIEEIKKEIQVLKPQSDECDQKLNDARLDLRKLIPDITEIQNIANRRSEFIEKKRKLERRILAIYGRYPTILNDDPHQVLSTDASVLERQLESTKQREEKAKEKITNLQRKIEKLEQQNVDLIRRNRQQLDVLHQRDLDKAQLTNSLQQELENAKSLYISDIRNIDRKLGFVTPLIEKMRIDVSNQKKDYQLLMRRKTSLLSTASSKCSRISKNITGKHKTIINNTKIYFDWWSHRRLNKHFTDRKEFLSNVLVKTKERYDSIHKSISSNKRSNTTRIEELKSLQIMNNQLEQKLVQVKQSKKKLKAEINSLRNSIKPLPTDIDQKLKSLRENLANAQNRAKSLGIEMRLYTTAEFVNEFESVRADYRNQIRRMVELQNSVKHYSQLLREKNEVKKQYPPLTDINDPRILISEEGQQTLVQAGPLDLLIKLLFNPSNDDILYPPGLLVLIHTEKSDLNNFVNLIISSYEQSNQETRDKFLKRLVDCWIKWFPNDFSDSSIRSVIVPLVNILGTSGIIETETTNSQIEIRTCFDDSVPYDRQANEIPFSAEPSIIVEHFTYIELQFLRSITASEFIGCGWSSFDKWKLAPNITKMMEHFNQISQWIVASIVLAKDLASRTKILEVWLKILDASWDFLNFQLVFIIYGALCSPSVNHLTKLWDSISPESKKIFDRFNVLTSPSARFENYRNELKKYPYEVVVPYIGPMLTSMVYISDGNPSKKSLPDVQEVVLNFQKHRMYASVIQEIMVNWGKEIRFTLNEELLNRIKNIPPVDQSESELFQISQTIKD
ncbi:RasGEF domain containing protein [Histomonas meleagridis]|uniref:RasGEF domain containing protein n=1 Tax=Histomonas meleagridis TaxID=135588 RepID=UPI0035599B14|nr:RasGEF domain containing protein [Histomonas meleagridis]KAH0801343.1 RasGEF domain containing protein [Histomonas meleagridis]